MPIVTIEGPAGVSKEIKKELIEKVSKIVADTYGMKTEQINVIIYENETDNVGVGGKQLTDLINK